jgi:hypothetical protein
MRTAQCAPLKHHYDECAERVQKQQEENGKAEEDCVEECESFLKYRAIKSIDWMPAVRRWVCSR